MKVYFQHDSPLDRLETDPDFDAGLHPETVTMYRRRMQQLRASLNELDLAQARTLDMRPFLEMGADFFTVFIWQGYRLVIHLMAPEPRREVAVLKIIQAEQMDRRLK